MCTHVKEQVFSRFSDHAIGLFSYTGLFQILFRVYSPPPFFFFLRFIVFKRYGFTINIRVLLKGRIYAWGGIFEITPTNLGSEASNDKDDGYIIS